MFSKMSNSTPSPCPCCEVCAHNTEIANDPHVHTLDEITGYVTQILDKKIPNDTRVLLENYLQILRMNDDNDDLIYGKAGYGVFSFVKTRSDRYIMRFVFLLHRYIQDIMNKLYGTPDDVSKNILHEYRFNYDGAVETYCSFMDTVQDSYDIHMFRLFCEYTITLEDIHPLSHAIDRLMKLVFMSNYHEHSLTILFEGEHLTIESGSDHEGNSMYLRLLYFIGIYIYFTVKIHYDDDGNKYTSM